MGKQTDARLLARRKPPIGDGEQSALFQPASTRDQEPLAGGAVSPQASENSSSTSLAADGAGYNFGQVAVLPATATAPQMKRCVSQPGDPHEREADEMAEQVMRLPDPEAAQETKRLSPPIPSTGAVSALPESSGQPLDAATRAFMEPRLGHDFGQVRVHRDEPAAEAAASYQARAYTVGRDIVFAAGEYAPGTTEGQRLLAHELTHVVQQGGDASATATVQRAPGPAATAATDDESDESIFDYLEEAAGFVENLVVEGVSFLTGRSSPQTHTSGPTAPPAHTSAPAGPSSEYSTSPAGPTTQPAPKTTPASPTAETPVIASAPDRAEIANALASITVSTRTRTEPMMRPWEIFQMMPQNTVTKKHLYLALKKAAAKLRAAEAKAQSAAGDAKKAKELETAQKAFDKTVQDLKAYVKQYVLGADRTLRGFRSREVALAAAIKRLNKKIAKAKDPTALQQDLDKKNAELAQLQEDEKSRHDEIANTIDGEPDELYELKDTTQTFYTITVDGATVSLKDHIDAYCTVVENGLEGGAVAAKGQQSHSVTELLEKDPTLSSSRKKILQMISHFEGGFTTMNTYDRAVLTWGMVQWTGGRQSDLTQALAVIKRSAPQAFAARFQKYGLDIDEKTDELVITPATGPQIRGAAAAQAIQESAKLTAVMSAAGTDPEIQLAELKAANELEINRSLNKKIYVAVPDAPDADADQQDSKAKKKKSHNEGIRVSDIFTSEAGVGIIANQTVHGGYPGGTLHAALEKFVKDKGWNPNDPSWIADAEQALIAHLSALDSDRAAALKKALDTAAGSFK